VTVESVSEQRTIVRLTNPEAVLASAFLGTSPELAGVARDVGERMARAAGALKQTAAGHESDRQRTNAPKC
jgi:hypothetical protein